MALACLTRLVALGRYGFDVALGESQALNFGRWITGDLGTYHVPVNGDVPEIEVHFVGEPDYQFNPMGARGVGEIGNTGLASAIGNAIYHATGARLRQLPMTPDRILMAMSGSPMTG